MSCTREGSGRYSFRKGPRIPLNKMKTYTSIAEGVIITRPDLPP